MSAPEEKPPASIAEFKTKIDNLTAQVERLGGLLTKMTAYRDDHRTHRLAAEKALEKLREGADIMAPLIHDYMRTVPAFADEPWRVAEHSYRVGLLALLATALGEE